MYTPLAAQQSACEHSKHRKHRKHNKGDTMRQLTIMACAGTALGFIVFIVAFFGATTGAGNAAERPLWIVFSLMGAIPVAIFAVLFGAMAMIKKELDEIRRDVQRLQRSLDYLADAGMRPVNTPPAETAYRDRP